MASSAARLLRRACRAAAWVWLAVFGDVRHQPPAPRQRVSEASRAHWEGGAAVKRLVSPALNPTGLGSSIAAVYAAVVMIANAVHHHAVINPQVIVAAIGAAAFLYSRFKVTPVADPRDGNGAPLAAAAPAPVVVLAAGGSGAGSGGAGSGGGAGSSAFGGPGSVSGTAGGPA
jgi:uncharacterized membrane protein YgcG